MMLSSPATTTPVSDLESLLAFRHSGEVLKNAGFVLNQYTVDEIERKRVCDRCGSSRERDKKNAKRGELRKLKSGAVKTDAKDTEKPSSIASLGRTLEAASINESKPDNKRQSPDSDKAVPPKETLRCRYHPGKYRKQQQAWSCCQSKLSGTPCAGSGQHALERSSLSELIDRYQVHQTPEEARPSGDYRSLVAVDCEMGTNIYNESELIRVSLVDVTSHEVLLDELVLPTVAMQHYNTRFSGVTYSMMENARRRRRCLSGTVQARQEIWKFVGPSTLVVGHDVKNDLKALRWIHLSLLDTLIMAKQLDPPQAPIRAQAAEQLSTNPAPAVADADDTKNPEPVASGDPQLKPGESPTPGKSDKQKRMKPPKGEGKYALKTLSARYLQREIQNGKKGHNSVEDALASGDLAIQLAAEINLRGSKTSSGSAQSPETSSEVAV